MKKNSFSFVKWLTTRDIEKIVDRMGFEVLSQEDSNKKKIIKYKDEKTGEYNIIVFCKPNKEESEKIGKAFSEIAKTKIGKNLILTTRILGIAGGMLHYDYMGNTILRFEDFFAYETLSIRYGEELDEFNSQTTKIYQNYMKEKFGKFYTSMKSAAYKKLYAEIRQEEAEQEKQEEMQEEQTEEK